MELLNSLRRGNLLFQNRTIYLFYHHKSHGKVKDKEHLKLRCLVQVGPGVDTALSMDKHKTSEAYRLCEELSAVRQAVSADMTCC